RSGCDAHVGFALADGLSGGKMSGGDAVVASDAVRGDSGRAEVLVEHFAAPRALFAIDDADVFSRQILNAADGAARASDQALLPDRKGHHLNGSLRKKMFDDGQIV